MLRPVVVLLLTAALLSGCSSKGPSQAEMERQAAQAIEMFGHDVLEGGRLGSVHIGGWIRFEAEVGGLSVRPQLAPDVDVLLGPAGEVRIDGALASMRFTGYCDRESIVTVTEKTSQYGIPEGSVESRNPIGHCTGPGSEKLLLQAFEFELVDPVLVTGQLDPDQMTPVRFSDVGKGKVEAEYTVTAPEGTTTLFLTVKGDRITRIIADNVDSNLVMDMAYGDRSLVEKPAAQKRVASAVTGVTSLDDDGWRWRGSIREGGPMSDYSLAVYEKDTSVSCGSAGRDAIVTFDLGGPALQEASGWRLLIDADNDTTLGIGDELLVTQPNAIVQEFDHLIVIRDDWAGSNVFTSDGGARLECATPGFGAGAGALGLVAALGVALRRR